MRTPREVILGRHQAAQPKLDVIREKVIADLAQGTSGKSRLRAEQGAGDWRWAGVARITDWRQFLWSLRWHLAGMTAAWVVAALLSIDRAPGPVQGVENRASTSPEQLLAALRENHRQVRELIAAPDSEPTPQPPSVSPSPHSQIRPTATREA